MKAHLVALCLSAACLFHPAVSPLQAEDRVLKAGAATSNITPELGAEIVGNYIRPVAANVHDELHARCLVVEKDDTTIAIVICDLIAVSANLSNAARHRIQERLGIPQENVLIAATHTHSAASARGSRSQKADSPLDDYQEFVCKRIVDGVQRAHHLRRPAEVGFGTVEAPEHVFNRRWIMKDGTAGPNPFGEIDKARMNPSRASENLVEPAGPTDPTVSFVVFREPAGRPISLLAAYSLHYVGGVRSGDISADYFGVFSEHLKQLVEQPPTPADAPFVAMMANGTSGDINNNNYAEKGTRRAPYEQMTRVGVDIATKVKTALDQVTWTSDITLDAQYAELAIERKPLSDELIEWSKRTLAATENAASPAPGKVNMPLIYAERVRQLSTGDRSPATTPIQHIRIGDIGIGTFPLEVFAETGLEFKERSPVKHPFMISLAHASLGYLPTPRHFELGGYETWPGANHLEQQASVKMMDRLLELAKQSLAPAAE